MLFKKHDFRPDRGSGTLNKLYLTKKQRRILLKWLLMALALVVLCVLQDVILSRVKIWGTTVDLMAVALLLACMLQDPEYGSIFLLTASTVYSFSGSAPGYYIIALLTVIGVFFAILRHCYLHETFGSTFLCTAAALLLYEMAVFCIGLFLGNVTLSRLGVQLIKTALSLIAVPILYPILNAILRIGGKTWNE